jgi:hypothetical protein
MATCDKLKWKYWVLWIQRVNLSDSELWSHFR